jgi:hypothetical protein
VSWRMDASEAFFRNFLYYSLVRENLKTASDPSICPQLVRRYRAPLVSGGGKVYTMSVVQKEETMPTVSGSFSCNVNVQTAIALSDQSDHELGLAEIGGVNTSSDENFNNAKLT